MQVIITCELNNPPTGVVDIDMEVYQQLQATGLFEYMDLDVDEAEHSLEMQVPFLQHVMG